MTPLVSIVVPTRNQGRFIEQTLASIIGQNWPRLELIVIDGASTDDTAAIVDKYRPNIAHFVSEPDLGQADAINKGFRLARGDILAWLNSDDYYLPCAIATAVRAIGENFAKPRLAYGGCLAVWEGASRAQAWLAPPYDREKLKTSACIFQASSFWTRSLWEQTGELNIGYQFVLDWDWFLRASEHCDFTSLSGLLSVYRFHADHKSSSGDSRRITEILELVERYAGVEWRDAFRDVAAQLDTLPASLARLRRFGLYRLRKLLHRRLYARHGGKVKVALSQLRV